MVGDRSDWCREAEGPPTRTREFSIPSHGRHSFSNNICFLSPPARRFPLPQFSVIKGAVAVIRCSCDVARGISTLKWTRGPRNTCLLNGRQAVHRARPAGLRCDREKSRTQISPRPDASDELPTAGVQPAVV